MRVTGGVARGTTLRSPKSRSVRPTTDLVRSALFNILATYGVEDSRVVDLFAGTGAVGIEALSRGAAHADFVEVDRAQVQVIRENLKVTKLSDRGTVILGDVRKVLGELSGGYDFILMDPPYTQPFPSDVVERIGGERLLSEDGIAVVGHASRVDAPELCGSMRRWQDRRYGDSSLAFYRLDANEASA